ncbi:hypothetical protein GRI40_12940 [Altererythrobacter aerius]|uniref:PepSY domain-containing protein n=1 Tax=Tsuneonella aeria TaxID=1837929 RepID=A0A6I4TEX3_9SPHN|nr:PepSY domain-containing protein [Tsuneonella aeria]MXO76119.1 hypothetical protein [Tsuneonella aeria]
MRLSPLFFRRVHKWIGLILGLQFVIWTISGAVMAVLDMNAVAGGPPPPRTEAIGLPASSGGWPVVQRTLGTASITSLTVRPLLNDHVFEIVTPAGTRLFDVRTGTSVQVDAALARRLAEASYTGSAAIRNVELLSEPTLAIREHEGPAWRVDFADESNSSFYISQATGRLIERRNDTWRIWDFVWMLHNMDYVNRTSFNHPLIITVGFGIGWLAITGFYLLFKTSWRPEARLLARLRQPDRQN